MVPGVGAFRDAIATLNQTGLADAIRDFVKTGKPFLGICLGLQLLLMDSGLRRRPAHRPWRNCRRLRAAFTVDVPPNGLKEYRTWVGTPLHFDKPSPLFKGLSEGSYVYFVHSYHVRPKGWISNRLYRRLWRSICGGHLERQYHGHAISPGERANPSGTAMLANFAAL